MANFNESAVLNGSQPFTLMGRDFEFEDGWIGYVSLHNGNIADSYTFNLNFRGSWTIHTLRLSGENMGLNVTNQNDGGERRIHFLGLGEDGSNLDLTGTRVTFIRGYEFENNRIRLGDGRTSAIELFDGNDTIIGGSGGMASVALNGGNDLFQAGTGWVASLNLGWGNDRLVAANGSRLGHVQLEDGNDTLTMAGDARIDSLQGWDGRKSVTLGGTSQINGAQLEGELVNVRLNGDARILTLKAGEGENRLTTADGNVESYFSFNGTNTLNIGAGGIQQVVFAGGLGKPQSISVEGFLGSLQSYQSATTAVLNGGAFGVALSNEADQVTTGSMEVVSLIMRGGNDVVNLGTGGARFVDLGSGDDLLRIRAMDTSQVMTIQGGDGLDTVDLAQFGRAVHVDLSLIGTLQNIGAAGGDLAAPGVAGYLSFDAVEHLTGGNFADVLIGADGGFNGENRLTGGGGNDRLMGLDGNDTLIGGLGRDMLTGGQGADLFQFGAADGVDRITDFEIGLDLLSFARADDLSDLRFTRKGDDVLVKLGKSAVTVEDVTLAEIRDEDNFLF